MAGAAEQGPGAGEHPLRPGVRLAFDVGTVRTGVARCDADAIMAVPLVTLTPTHDDALIFSALDLIEEWDPVEILVGDPKHMSGKPSNSSARALWLAKELAGETRVPVRMVDERLTTVTATGQLHDSGRSTRTQRAVVDQVAATVLLEHALASERANGTPPGRLIKQTRKGRR
ncbi:MAG: Holliday junction resolvase RuvX [Buchananella hordeovulneris]|nr:Holliday junction resolvase RuvX [Buchananella hordeovulneris]